MICACGKPMVCVITRPYQGDPKIVRIRIYRCPHCGSKEGTTEVLHKLVVIKRAINRQHYRRERELKTKRGLKCRT